MCAVAAPASAADLYVVDGDTIFLGGERIRLTSDAGPIDAPEIHQDGWSRAKCPLELLRAAAARDRLKALLGSGDYSIDRREVDSHGRSVAVIYADGVDVASVLVREGLARPWPRPFRGNKPEWCGR